MEYAIFLSIFDWSYHSHGHADFQLAQAFSRRMPIYFVNSIGMRRPRRRDTSAPYRRIARKLGSTFRMGKTHGRLPNVSVISPKFIPAYSGLCGDLNFKLLAHQIRHHVHARGDAIVVVTCPTFAPVALQLPCKYLIYYRSDDHSTFPGADSALIKKFEDMLFSQAQVVLYSNHNLYEREFFRAKGKGLFIGHGVDERRFCPDGPVSEEIISIPGPRAGFFGDLHGRSVDFDLVADVADLCPEVSFVLAGSRLEPMRRLCRTKNVYLFDECPHEQMPARWRSIDVAMLPYRSNAWLSVAQPVKLNEILATGIPIVGTMLPGLPSVPGRHVLVQADTTEFATALRLSVQSANCVAPHVLRALRASRNLPTWDSITQRILAFSRA